jgi:putative two-component system response regulator
MARVLVVDDNTGVQAVLCEMLVREGYEVVAAADGREALEVVRRQPPDLVLLDLNMPHVSGDEVCRQLKSNRATRLVPVIMLTGQGDTRTRLEAWEYGADEFLPKPLRLVEVKARCRSLLRIKELVEQRDSAESVVFSLVRALDAKNRYTRGHADRVADYSVRLARAVGLGEDDVETLRKGALLHDIGKIGIPDAILNKPGKLDAAETAVIRAHPAEGARIVEPLASVRAVRPIIRWHHERLDGSGYPDGLRGDEISLPVRIVAVTDVFDSLSSERPYRPAIAADVSLGILREEALNGWLDPELVALFAEMVAREGTVLALANA